MLKKLQSEELHNLYFKPNIIQVIMCSTHGGIQNEYKILVRKPEGKKQVGRQA
jgi:hypothetical protein